MEVTLTKVEAISIQECIEEHIDFMEMDLKSLTEPDERYERNDLFQQIQQMRALKKKFDI